jgi:hypothetical protein
MQRTVPLRPSRWVAIGLDSVLLVAAYGGALVFRFSGSVPSWYAEQFAASIILIVATYVLIGLLNWVYSPRRTMLRVFAASLFSLCLVVALSEFMARPLPLSVTVLGGLVSLVGLAGLVGLVGLVGWRLAASAWLY